MKILILKKGYESSISQSFSYSCKTWMSTSSFTCGNESYLQQIHIRNISRRSRSESKSRTRVGSNSWSYFKIE